MNWKLFKSKVKYPANSVAEKYAIKINKFIDKYGKTAKTGVEERIMLEAMTKFYKDFEKDAFKSFGIVDYEEVNSIVFFDTYVEIVYENIKSYLKERNLENIYEVNVIYQHLLENYIDNLLKFKASGNMEAITGICKTFLEASSVIDKVKNGLLSKSSLDSLVNIDFSKDASLKENSNIYICHNEVEGLPIMLKKVGETIEEVEVISINSDGCFKTFINKDIFLKYYSSLEKYLANSSFIGNEYAGKYLLYYLGPIEVLFENGCVYFAPWNKDFSKYHLGNLPDDVYVFSDKDAMLLAIINKINAEIKLSEMKKTRKKKEN